MKQVKLKAFIVACTIVTTLITPLQAKEVDVDSSQLSTGMIDTTPVVETYNEKVRMYESMKSGARQTIPYNKIISVNFQTQQNSYYCGPAFVRMVLGATGKIYEQDYIASQIGTTTAGTGFGGTLLNAMNRLCGSGFSFNLVWGESDLANKARIAIYCGNPVLVDTCETNNFRIAGHEPWGIEYHYAVINGYRNSGNTLVYTDPAYGMYKGTNLQCDYQASLLAELCSNLGYIW